MIFDGKAFAKSRLAALHEERKSFGSLSLGIVVASNDPVTSSYVKIKERNAHALAVELVRYHLAPGATTEDAVALVHEAAQKNDGVIVQLPLPSGIDASVVVNAMPCTKDVDVISEEAAALFAAGKHVVMPPVASAINEIIDAHNIAVEGKRAVVVGKGKLVGIPAEHLLRMRGADVVALDHGDDLATHTTGADIIVLGAGSPQLLQPDMVKDGVVIFDAGTSESGGAIVGDADPTVAAKASFFTPVPGGIGPVAVVEIFANLLALKARV